MSRRRAAGLGALLVVLAAYGAVAGRLPGLPSGVDIAFHAVVVFPAFAAAIWVALPLARLRSLRLLGLAGAAGVAAVALTLAEADATANVAKLACFALAGFWFLTLFEELWWLALVAVLVPWVDIWSVAAGPTEYVVEERPGIFEQVSIAFPAPGDTATVNLGPPDVVFFALFLAAADRFRLRVAATWVGIERMPRRDTRSRLVLGRHRRPPGTSGHLSRLPRPERRPALARRPPGARELYGARLSKDTDSTCGVCGNMSTGRQRSRT